MRQTLVTIAMFGIARLALAQDAGEHNAAPQATEPAGGHDIAVFSGIAATPAPQPEWHSAPRRHAYGWLADRAPLGGIEGFTLGRQYNLEYLALADVGDPLRAGNDVRYYSSRTAFEGGGLSTGASWTVDTMGGNPMADKAWGMTVGVDLGALSLRAAHQNRHVAQVRLYDLAGNNMDAKNSMIAANLRLRWGTAYAAYAASRGWGNSPLYNPDNPYGAGVASTSSTDSRDTLVGVAVPMTRSTTFLASFIRKNDRDLANRDARQFAIGASHVVSRKTDFYAALSHTVNLSSSGVLISGAARPSGSSAINVGMRHAF